MQFEWHKLFRSRCYLHQFLHKIQSDYTVTQQQQVEQIRTMQIAYCLATRRASMSLRANIKIDLWIQLNCDDDGHGRQNSPQARRASARDSGHDNNEWTSDSNNKGRPSSSIDEQISLDSRVSSSPSAWPYIKTQRQLRYSYYTSHRYHRDEPLAHPGPIRSERAEQNRTE